MDIDSHAAVAEKALQELKQALQISAPRGSIQQRQQGEAACERLAQRTKNSLDSYKLELRALPGDQQAEHVDRLRTLEEGLRHCRAQMDWRRLDKEALAAQEQAASCGGGAAPGALGPAGDGVVTLDQAVAAAESMQEESSKSVMRSMKMVLQAEQIGIATLDEMHKQEEQMDRIEEVVYDIQADLKRSKKLVVQMARSAASDRLIWILCALITVAIMVMIVLAATGKDGGQLNVPDEVRQVGRG